MRIAYFDCMAGASGDMLLAALIDAGARSTSVREAIHALGLEPKPELILGRVNRSGISAQRAEIITNRHVHHRHANEILSIVNNAPLSMCIREKACGIIKLIAETEAGIHGCDPDTIHLHELGGDDTIADIVGVLAALHDLKVDKVFVSSLPLGHGHVNCAHGHLPLPAPAVLSILVGKPVYYVDVDKELVTPTGAAILASLGESFGRGWPRMILQKTGYGAGSRDLSFPNVVRVMLGEIEEQDSGLVSETLNMIETNIDDMNPQIFDHVMKKLFEKGALDVTLTPVHMKKNRPGTTVSVLCHMDRINDMISGIIGETTTLGVRIYQVERLSLQRRMEEIETPFGRIRVKVVEWANIKRRLPEYDDCRKAACKHGVPIATVMAETLAAARGVTEGETEKGP